MQKLWQKNWTLDKTIEAFETKTDLVLDQKLIQSDILGSLAHAHGLYKIGILTDSELEILIQGLQDVYSQTLTGNFQLEFGDEDIHTKLEHYLTEVYGEVGKKIHTGRSRNDQVLTAIRLYTKEQLLLLWKETLELIRLFINLAEENKYILMPGYTHQQKAMPSSIEMWSGSFAEALLDDVQVLKSAFELNDQSPLGSAAGYGVPLELDRHYTATVLGFTKVQNNSLYCQNSRGKIEGVVVACLITILQEINKFATDVLFFTTAECGFLSVASELCSGSSIMPQKRNVDIAELLRSKIHLVLGNYTQLVSLSANLLSGYNRDLQDSKKSLFESLELTIECVQVTQLLVSSVSVQTQKIESAVTSELFATQYALDLVQKGIPFREAYKRASSEYRRQPVNVYTKNKKTHAGGIADVGISRIKSKLKAKVKLYKTKNKTYLTVKNNLLQKKGSI
jgi:argininosuccinate lyase